MQVDDRALAEFIAETGLVSRKDIDAAFERAGQKKVSLGDALLDTGAISEADLQRAEGYVLGIPLTRISADSLELDALALVPEPIARIHGVISFKKEGDVVSIAAARPSAFAKTAFLTETGLKVRPHLTSPESIRTALLKYQKALKAEFGAALAFQAGAVTQSDDAAAARAVDALIRHALIQGASHIHIEPQEKDATVRYRIGGAVHDALIVPKPAYVGISSRLRSLAGFVLSSSLTKEGRFKIELNGERTSFVIRMMPAAHGERISLRISRDGEGDAIEDVARSNQTVDRIRDAMDDASRAIIVADQDAGERQKTLYSFIRVAGSRLKSVISIEEKICEKLPRVAQSEVRPGIGFGFAAATRAAVRHDADVVAISDIPDGETAALLFGAATTGRFVLAGMSASSAANALCALRDVKGDAGLVGSSISLVIAERKVKKLAPGCERRPLAKKELSALSKAIDLDRVLGFLRDDGIIGADRGWEDVRFGFPRAGGKGGYEGTIAIREALKMSPSIKELLFKKASAGVLEAQAKKEGMATLLEDGIMAAAAGLTSIEEVLASLV